MLAQRDMRNESASSDHMELLARVAELYFQFEMTQAQIAKQTGYSRSMISRLLTEARQQGVVEVRINHPLKRRLDLEAALQAKFKLKHVRVLAHNTLGHSQMLRRLGSLAATLVQELVQDSMTIGVSWGTALAETVAALRPQPRTGIRVAQIIGSSGAADPDIDGPELARKLARVLGAKYSTLPAPLFVHSEATRYALIRDPRVREVLGHSRTMALLLCGVGTIDIEYSSLLRSGSITLTQVEQLVRASAVGECCGHVFDVNGRTVDTAFTRQVIGLTEYALKRIPLRVGIAGGLAKATPVLGALRGGWINGIVTDEIAAVNVLSAEEP